MIVTEAELYQLGPPEKQMYRSQQLKENNNMNTHRTKATIRRELKDTIRRIDNHEDKILKLKIKENLLQDELRNVK